MKLIYSMFYPKYKLIDNIELVVFVYLFNVVTLLQSLNV